MARPPFFLLFSAPCWGLHCSQMSCEQVAAGPLNQAWPKGSFPRSPLAGLPTSSLVLLRVLGQLPSGPQKGNSTQLKTRSQAGCTKGSPGELWASPADEVGSSGQVRPRQLAFKATQELCRAATAVRPRPVVSGPTRPPTGPFLGRAHPSPARPNFPSPQSVRFLCLCAFAVPHPAALCPPGPPPSVVSILGPLLLPSLGHLSLWPRTP